MWRGAAGWLVAVALVAFIVTTTDALPDEDDRAQSAVADPTLPEQHAITTDECLPGEECVPVGFPSDPPSTPVSDPSATVGPRGDDAPVVRQGPVAGIVDGDTFDLVDGTRVRLAITDTPEVHGGVEACGAEAHDFAADFLAGQTVALYRPASGPATDPFGRTLGEVVRASDGASLNVALVAAGLGTIDERFTHEDPDLAGRLRTASATARTPACASVDPGAEPTDAPPATTAPPRLVPAEPTPTPTEMGHGGRTDSGWDCHPAYFECLPIGPDLDCADVGHGVRLLGDDDPYRLDGNNTHREDGDGCESYPPWSASTRYPYEP